MPLSCNQKPKRCFQGKIPGYDGFLIDEATAFRFRSDSAEVIFPYLTGRELLGEFRIERWVIDFGSCDMIGAARFDSAFEHCRREVLPKVQQTYADALRTQSDMIQARKEHLDRWWQLWNRRDELTAELRALPRYLACSRVTRRPIMTFVSSSICPSDLVQVFGFADDYSFGILQSTIHFEWFRRNSSRLKIESDMRYSVRDVFETFPWPQGASFLGPTTQQIEAVVKASREILCVRREALKRMAGGLRALYRTLDLPGRSALKDAHEKLDAAVRAAYNFRSDVDPTQQLVGLNRLIAARIAARESVVAPGIPPTYPDVVGLTTNDCYGA